MPSALPDAALHRFSTDLTQLIGPDPATLGLAVSGGPDSLALLLLVHATGLACEAATVDHGLRATSGEEAAFVASLCHNLGVPHQILTLGEPGNGNLSDWARKERYATLARWADNSGCAYLLTAHHADDQLETMIMRINRSSGVAGIAGIRARRGTIVRPLLGWRKSELVDLVKSCGVVPIDDPTNRDDRFDRARLRKALSDAAWLDPVAASRSASALADAEEALDWAAQDYGKQRIADQNGGVSFDPQGLPKEIIRRIVHLCLEKVQPGIEPRGEALERLIFALHAGQKMTLGNVKCSGGPTWHFAPAPPRRTD